VLRPPSSSPDVEARAFLVQGGVAHAWSAPVDVSPSGAVHIAGDVASLFAGTHGPVTIAIAVGPRGHAPTDPAVVAGALDAASPPPHDWQMFTHRAVVR
jgi:hypothetical protein